MCCGALMSPLFSFLFFTLRFFFSVLFFSLFLSSFLSSLPLIFSDRRNIFINHYSRFNERLSSRIDLLCFVYCTQFVFVSDVRTGHTLPAQISIS